LWKKLGGVGGLKKKGGGDDFHIIIGVERRNTLLKTNWGALHKDPQDDESYSGHVNVSICVSA